MSFGNLMITQNRQGSPVGIVPCPHVLGGKLGGNVEEEFFLVAYQAFLRTFRITCYT